MNKHDLTDRMVKATGIGKNDVLKFLDALLEVVRKELNANGRVSLARLGTFTTVSKKQKKGRNPRTGEEIVIPRRKAVKFLPAKGLKELFRGTDPGYRQIQNLIYPHGPGDGPDED